ncbi:MAG: phosphodiester glycosidase family protein [Actinomycetes bacterium]
MPITAQQRAVAALGAGVLAATLLAAVSAPAEAARACRIEVTTRIDAKERFAGPSIAKYVYATANGSAVGQFDHAANVIMTTYPQGAYPSLVNKKVGELEAVGSMLQSQAPTALGGINADFFVFADVRYETQMEMARGPMVKEGVVIRGTAQTKRVVGIDTLGQPYGGELGVRGFITPKVAKTPKVAIRSVNWHVLLDGGANLYTTDWSGAKRTDGLAKYPRPAGVLEWVLNRRNKITSIRSASQNASLRGAPVVRGTRVVAFSADTATTAGRVSLGTKIKVGVRQKTDTGTPLVTGVGRGLPIVEAGKPAPLGCGAYAKTSGAKAARPRTFVGWDGKGRWRTFTVPGTSVSSSGGKLVRAGGLGLANAANVARALGMKYAYELDGGGSTSLWTRQRSVWSRQDLYGVSNPSHCVCERWMANGLSFLPGP